MMTKEQFLFIFYGKHIIIFGILLWLCIHYCRKGFFRFSFEKMIDWKGKRILEKKKHFLEVSVNILILLMMLFVRYFQQRQIFLMRSKTSLFLLRGL